MLSVEPTADADTIKKAFRREIARYHPDKVIHLGPEFQEMAATRAAALTAAYKTLSDPVLRQQYDGDTASALPPTVTPDPLRPPASPGTVASATPPPMAEVDAPQPSGGRLFESERAGRDQILRRAIAARVQAQVVSLFGAVETPVVRGFDFALVPVARPRFLGNYPPRVLGKVNAMVDAEAVAEAWTVAARSRIQAGKSPVIVLLFGRQLAPLRELLRAMEQAAGQRPAPDSPDELVVVVVNSDDWTCHAPDQVSATVRKLIDKVCG